MSNFLKKKEIWISTGLGWLTIVLGGLIILAVVATGIHPFLAVNRPVGGDLLVVEGWLPKYALETVVADFHSKGYRRLIATGIPIPEPSYFRQCFPDFDSYAEVTAASIRALGVASNRVVAVPAAYVPKDRTYSTAAALKNWLRDSGTEVQSLDVYSMGPHARRTWLLFEAALGGEFQVGIVALKRKGYDPDAWWRSSAGVRTVMAEGLAYLYARFLFSPAPQGSG